MFIASFKSISCPFIVTFSTLNKPLPIEVCPPSATKPLSISFITNAIKPIILELSSSCFICFFTLIPRLVVPLKYAVSENNALFAAPPENLSILFLVKSIFLELSILDSSIIIFEAEASCSPFFSFPNQSDNITPDLDNKSLFKYSNNCLLIKPFQLVPGITGLPFDVTCSKSTFPAFALYFLILIPPNCFKSTFI